VIRPYRLSAGLRESGVGGCLPTGSTKSDSRTGGPAARKDRDVGHCRSLCQEVKNGRSDRIPVLSRDRLGGPARRGGGVGCRGRCWRAGRDGRGRREDWTGQDTAGRRGTRTKYLLRADQAPCAATHAKRKGPSFHTAVTEGSAGQWLFRSPG